MKKSKFLLLGSVASLASIPFVAAKCGETKRRKETWSPDKTSWTKTLVRNEKRQWSKASRDLKDQNTKKTWHTKGSKNTREKPWKT
nr:variable surface lipoprotein [Mycoplasmopsis bovis]